jgi:hypothetical protein
MPEAQWPAIPLYLDTTTAAPGDRNGTADSGDIVISDRITKYIEPPTPPGGTDPGDFVYASNTWVQTAVSNYFEALSLEVRQTAARLMMAPKLTVAGSVLFPEAKGSFLSRNYGERMPVWGGDWRYGAGTGLAYLELTSRRSYVLSYVGLRPAFIL